jgi:acyl carrier protein
MSQKILVIDDDKNLVEIYQRALERAGYQVFCAYQGKEGLTTLKKNPVDLIILDLKMPKMGGVEFLNTLRKDPQFKETKVLIMSSVLYKYRRERRKIFPLYERVTKVAETKFLRKVKRFSQEESPIAIQEKQTKTTTPTYLGFAEESDPKFRRRISVDLVRKVREMLGESKETLAEPLPSSQDLEEKLKNIILKYVNATKEELDPQASFTKDLGVDSLETVEILMEVEEEFGLEISDEDAEKLTTVKEAFEYIQRRLKEKETELKA